MTKFSDQGRLIYPDWLILSLNFHMLTHLLMIDAGMTFAVSKFYFGICQWHDIKRYLTNTWNYKECLMQGPWHGFEAGNGGGSKGSPWPLKASLTEKIDGLVVAAPPQLVWQISFVLLWWLQTILPHLLHKVTSPFFHPCVALK